MANRWQGLLLLAGFGLMATLGAVYAQLPAPAQRLPAPTPAVPVPLSDLEVGVAQCALNYLLNAVSDEDFSARIPDHEARQSLDYFADLPRDKPPVVIPTRHARNGLAVLERCCVVLKGDFELNALIGTDAEIAETIRKLRALLGASEA